jgi:hypothetical protein
MGVSGGEGERSERKEIVVQRVVRASKSSEASERKEIVV